MAGLRPPKNMSAEFARMFAETRREPVLHEALNAELRAIERDIKSAAAKGDMTCPLSLASDALGPLIRTHLEKLGYWIETSHYYPSQGEYRMACHILHWDTKPSSWFERLFGDSIHEWIGRKF